MEKHLSTAGYWLGIVCTVLALACRIFLAFNTNPLTFGVSDGLVISYNSFFHGAALFFLLSIASALRSPKA